MLYMIKIVTKLLQIITKIYLIPFLEVLIADPFLSFLHLVSFLSNLSLPTFHRLTHGQCQTQGCCLHIFHTKGGLGLGVTRQHLVVPLVLQLYIK